MNSFIAEYEANAIDSKWFHPLAANVFEMNSFCRLNWSDVNPLELSTNITIFRWHWLNHICVVVVADVCTVDDAGAPEVDDENSVDNKEEMVCDGVEDICASVVVDGDDDIVVVIWVVCVLAVVNGTHEIWSIICEDIDWELL